MISAFIFLLINDIEIESNQNDLEEIVMNVAKGKMNKREIALWLEKNVKI